MPRLHFVALVSFCSKHLIPWAERLILLEWRQGSTYVVFSNSLAVFATCISSSNANAIGDSPTRDGCSTTYSTAQKNANSRAGKNRRLQRLASV
jgi:hypothetical protein